MRIVWQALKLTPLLTYLLTWLLLTDLLTSCTYCNWLFQNLLYALIDKAYIGYRDRLTPFYKEKTFFSNAWFLLASSGMLTAFWARKSVFSDAEESRGTITPFAKWSGSSLRQHWRRNGRQCIAGLRLAWKSVEGIYLYTRIRAPTGHNLRLGGSGTAG